MNHISIQSQEVSYSHTLVDKLIEAYTKAGVEIHYMTQAEFNAWLEFAKKTAWKNYAETVPGGQELLNLAAEAMK